MIDLSNINILDISKVFDKVWHGRWFVELPQNGTCGEMINIFEDFFSDKKKRAILNDQCSSSAAIRAFVPQVPILGLF